MKQGTEHSPNNGKKNKYVSCIRINGVPILPPLITSEKRKELRRYRREAIKVEKRLQREKELKDYISQLYRTCSREFENDGLNTTIESIVEEVEATNFHEIPDITSTNVRNKDEMLDKSADTQEDLTFSHGDFDNSKLQDEQSNEGSKTPKLIRSNSYIVEAPSPALLEYLRTQEGRSYCWNANTNLSPKESTSTEIKDECDMTSEVVHGNHDSCNNFDSISDSTIIEQPQIICDDLHVSSIGDETPRAADILKKPICKLETKISILNVSDDCYDTSRTETELRNLSDCESQIHQSDNNIQAFIVNNVPDGEHLNEADISVSSNKSELPIELCANTDLNSILNKIPAEYSRRILDILERHQFTNYIADRFEDIHLEPEKYSTPHDTGMCETIYYSVDGDDNESTLHEQNEQQKDEKVIRKEKEILTRNKAASILCAATKGFLVRRLMKTERVQNLIQTIKDTLTCAVELHQDTLEHIEEADVELHRRLIQQVSAACDTFHDVFFATSTQDQMLTIAVDRQKKREKLRRLSSSNSTASNKSSSRSIGSSFRSANRKSRNLSIHL